MALEKTKLIEVDAYSNFLFSLVLCFCRRDLVHDAGEEESLLLELDIGGGLVLDRKLTIPKSNPKVFQIDSNIKARKVGAGSGGFSRLICIRVHPTFNLLHPTESFVSFTSVNGSKHEVWPESEEQFFEGDLLPNECASHRFFRNTLKKSETISNLRPVMRMDACHKCLGVGLVNRFNAKEVYKCFIHWGTGTVNLELWSEERPVSKQPPLRICHEYEVINIA
ncbi:hypothetical protein Patl1_29883 [Pistacia atlantica]|uniref:Uncharacterized protein n=1 Tax=Pistacia atlantica TaxID=434234 RepID=A0ACC1ADD6_9ROSI|nr:hypothetical protein Patl1_29883 [Pistacia atlantica]